MQSLPQVYWSELESPSRRAITLSKDLYFKWHLAEALVYHLLKSLAERVNLVASCFLTLAWLISIEHQSIKMLKYCINR